jgi:hypothetical protein
MRNFKLPIYENRLEDKKDLQNMLKQILEPLKSNFCMGNTRLHLGNTSAHYTDSVAGLEGFSRLLWGLAPFQAGGDDDDEIWSKIIKGIENGSDPESEYYWGNAFKFDQRLVEMAAFGYAMVLAPEKFWDPLSKEAKDNLYQWLDQVNHVELIPCNWQFFRVLVNVAFKHLGLTYNQEKLEESLDMLDSYYVEEGWYRDGGDDANIDYYLPFAMHYYGLFFAKYMSDVYPKRSKRYNQRAATFAKEYIYWSSKNGASIPFGRSQTYRFAQGSFWSMLVYTDVELPFELGVIKGIILRHLRWWMKQPIFNENGILTIGYAYPNLNMAECYNSPTSPYWALKTLTILALEDDHPFWSVAEKALPKLEEKHIQYIPKRAICRGENSDQVLKYNSGAKTPTIFIYEKYQKLVYSTLFGFSIPRANSSLEQGAYDNCLALSEEGHYWRSKRVTLSQEINEDFLKTVWKPWNDVEIESWVVFGYPWHLRIHKINTKRKLQAAEGGFAIAREKTNCKVVEAKEIELDNGIAIKTDYDYSLIKRISGFEQSKIIYAEPNTNLISSRTAIPTLVSDLEIGENLLVSYIAGDELKAENYEEALVAPQVEILDDKILVYPKDSTEIVINI